MGWKTILHDINFCAVQVKVTIKKSVSVYMSVSILYVLVFYLSHFPDFLFTLLTAFHQEVITDILFSHLLWSSGEGDLWLLQCSPLTAEHPIPWGFPAQLPRPPTSFAPQPCGGTSIRNTDLWLAELATHSGTF